MHWSYSAQIHHVIQGFLETHNLSSTLLLPCRQTFVSSYIEKLFKGKREAGLVICGSFGLHMHDSLLEDLLVTNVGLDQSPEARNNSVGLLIELEGGNTKIQRSEPYCIYIRRNIATFKSASIWCKTMYFCVFCMYFLYGGV